MTLDALIEQHAGTNLGKMVGIDANVISGDVYVERISQIQIVTLTPEGREANADRFINVSTRPYLSLYPYSASDEALFRGRNKEIERIVETMQGQRLLVVYGQAGVGKTSLLAAGAIPRLAREGVLAILVQDFKEPAKTIIEGLSLGGKRFLFDLPGESPLPVLLAEIIKKVKGTLVLVFDQFELLFEPAIGEELRRKFIEELAEALRTIDGSLLRVIVVARTESLAKLGEIENHIPRLLQCPIHLLPMTRSQALSAIEEPLYVVKPETSTVFEPKLTKEQLLPDLDELTADEPGFIHPQHLQIVCDELYRNAHTLGQVRVITSELYTQELKGADGILASFMRRMMQTRVEENQQDCALQLLAIMASPGAKRWMKPADFDLKDIDNTEIENILEKLVEARLLIRAYDAGEMYCLVSQLITRELRRLSGTGKQVEERYNAEDELERIWNTWLSLEHYASREQLRYLVRSGDHLDPRAVKTLLMLRSAVEADEDAGIWLGRLRGDHNGQRENNAEGGRLIRQLETNEEVVGDHRIGKAMLANATRLLGSAEQELSSGARDSQPSEAGETFGAVAQNAVSGCSSAIRQTCALALAAVEPAFAVTRLNAALRKVKGTRRRRVLRSELFGALADGDPEIASLNTGLPLLQRIFIWDWRVRRRIWRDSRRLAWLTLGGAIGAGLGVGLLRAWLALPPNELPGQQFWFYFFLAGVLGAALSCGMGLAKPLHSVPSNPASDSLRGFRTSLSAVALGTIFFGIAHSILWWLNHELLIGAYYIILMGFSAGLGLSIALSFSVPSMKFSNALNWIWRSVVAGLTFVLIDQFFVSMRQRTSGGVLMTQISMSRGVLRGLLELEKPPWRLDLFKSFSQDAQMLSILCGVLTGVFIVTGLGLGRKLANRVLSRNNDFRGS